MQLAQPQASSSTLQQIMALAGRLSDKQQQSALEYLTYLAWQNEQTHQKTTHAQGRFDDVFGFLTAKNGVSIDEMNETIAERGSE